MNRIFRAFEPSAELSQAEQQRGMRWLTIEGVAQMGYGSITGSGFLAAFALILGANNFHIGVLAALPFLAMPVQVFTVALVEKVRRRKLIALTTWAAAQLLWFPIGLIPFVLDVPSAGAVSLLLLFVALRSIFAALQNAAWNSWMRSIVSAEIMGAFFARRLSYANVAAMAFGLGAAAFVDYWESQAAVGDEVFGYSIAILFGALLLGMGSVVARGLMPEPSMPAPEGPPKPVLTALAEPFRDDNFKHLIRFQAVWGFALQLAVPFFAVYMLTVLDLPLTAVLGFSVLSQASNVVFLRMWGPMVDRVGSKPILTLSVSLYLLVILGWTFTTMPDRYFLTIPLLIVLHILAGAASAGTNATTGIITFKLAPPGSLTAYVSAASLAANLGSGLGPLVGGRFVDFFSVRSLTLNLTWQDPARMVNLPALDLAGYDFLFLVTFVLGILTLPGLAALRETGEVPAREVLDSLMDPMRRATAPMSSVPGFGLLSYPLGVVRNVPGLDIAVGVTAYQIAESARAATQVATRGLETTTRLVSAVEHTVRAASMVAEAQAGQVARNAARGVMQALDHTTTDIRSTTRQAFRGIMSGLSERARKENLEDLLAAAAYGTVEGALAAGLDIEDVSAAAVEAAREIANEHDADGGEAAEHAAEAVIRAAQAIHPESAERVRRRVRDQQAEEEGPRLE